MDIETRIERRRRRDGDQRLVLDYAALSPVASVEEPVGRGPVLERLLDYLQPVFDGKLPPDAYVWGPSGSGKSAALRALVARLSEMLSASGSGSVVHTSTRVATPLSDAPAFVYVDTRRADSRFGLQCATLDGLLKESVPRQGIGTEAVRSRLVDHLDGGRTAVVVVDHVGDPGGVDRSTVRETFAPVDDSLATVTVGRQSPEELPDAERPPERIEVPPYEPTALADVVTARASDGVAQQAVSHEQVRRLSEWAAGDAHDALAALFGAAAVAERAGRDRIRERDLTDGMDAVPRPSAPLGRVLTLPENRQLVLRKLLDLAEPALSSVDAAADGVAGADGVDLSPATVKRFLYELAELDVVERVTAVTDGSAGRPPSRLDPRFPTLAFRRLYDLD
ncbi:MAG: Cdc6/Cdc18 family protein, partial [Halolamina sp.]